MSARDNWLLVAGLWTIPAGLYWVAAVVAGAL